MCRSDRQYIFLHLHRLIGYALLLGIRDLSHRGFGQ